MERIVGVCLFTFLSFLLWFYLATDHSTIGNWWSVIAINEMTSENESITVIRPIYSVSVLKVFIGLAFFILLGILLSFIMMKRKY